MQSPTPRLRATVLALVTAATLLASGCAQRTYIAGPPPVPPPIVQEADQNGYRFGFDSGLRDFNRGYGYHPRADRAFHDAPGYDPRFGPFGVYQANFRNAYMRGYNHAFNRG
jgi:hypothetical protein